MGSASLVMFARLSGLVIAVLVVYWALLLVPRQGLTYSTLHPLLMVIGFILVSGEAILIHRWLPGSRKTKKAVHLWLQGVALVSAVFGIWTKFHSQLGVFSNFYSLHSWMGLLSVSLFAAQGHWKRVAEEEAASRKLGLGIRPLPKSEEDIAAASNVKFNPKFDKNRRDKRARIHASSISPESSYSMSSSSKKRLELEAKRRKICAASASESTERRIQSFIVF